LRAKFALLGRSALPPLWVFSRHHRSRCNSENVAIHAWIARQFSEARLLPDDPWEQFQALSVMSWCASSIHPYLSRLNNPKKVCDIAGAFDSVNALAKVPLMEGFQMAEQLFAGKDYLFGNYTGPDGHLFWCMRRAQQLGLDLSEFPNAMAHHARMLERASVKKLLDFEAATLQAFAVAS
jgi:glutathione S-transferase